MVKIKTFQKCNPSDSKPYLVKSNVKNFPIWCNVNFETVFSALNNSKRTINVTLDDIGNLLLVNLPRQNFKSGGLNL